MFNAPPALSDTPATPAERRAEARVRRLQRMADLGVDIGEKLQRQAELAAAHAETDAVPDNLPHAKRLDEIARSFARVSRAVALATALEDRIDRGLPALPFEDRARQERDAKDKRVEAARAVLHDLDAVCSGVSPRRAVDLRLRLDRLLDAELADLDRFLERPFDEILARLRREMGLEDPSPVRGRMGPVAKRREDGVTDAGRETPPPPTVVSKPRPPVNDLPPSATPSSRADLPPAFAGVRCAGPVLPLTGEGSAFPQSRALAAGGEIRQRPPP